MLDIGVIIQAPMEDEEWLKKCALMGLITFGLMLVPLAGAFLSIFNLLGWMRTYAESRLQGHKTLPPPGLAYLGAGWKTFVMMLPLVGALIALYIVIFAFVAIGAATKLHFLATVGSLLGLVTILPLALWTSVMMPGILYMHIVEGEPWASVKFGRQWRLMTAAGTEYLLFWVAILVAGIVGELGMIACGIGLVVSVVYGQAMYGAAISEFARVAKEKGVVGGVPARM